MLVIYTGHQHIRIVLKKPLQPRLRFTGAAGILTVLNGVVFKVVILTKCRQITFIIVVHVAVQVCNGQHHLSAFPFALRVNLPEIIISYMFAGFCMEYFAIVRFLKYRDTLPFVFQFGGYFE